MLYASKTHILESRSLLGLISFFGVYLPYINMVSFGV